MIDWLKALEVFVVGFSGVFVVLIIMQFCISLFSRMIRLLPRKEVKK